MSKDVIDRKALLKTYKNWLPQLEGEKDKGDRRGVETCIAVLEDAPAVDAVPVVHGKWEFEHMTGDRSYYAHCSECGKRKFFKDYDEQDNYCSNCGADMREVEHETD